MCGRAVPASGGERPFRHRPEWETSHGHRIGQGVPYEVMTHERTVRSSATAKASFIPESDLAKGVLIKCKDSFLLAVVPGPRHVHLDAVGTLLQQPGLATEAEAARIFPD